MTKGHIPVIENNQSHLVMLHLVALSVALPVAVATSAHAQNSSLFARDLPLKDGQTMSLVNTSWTYRQLPPPQEIKVHDIISIRVDEKSQTIAEGEVERRKNALYDAVLRDWLVLSGLMTVKPDPQPDGDQRVQGKLNQLFRSEAELQTREALKFHIAAHIVDIRPNGNLVFEAHRVIRVNDETWEYSLTGICRKEAIAPGFFVLSRDIAELNIHKRERGHVRDGYRRGWFQRWFDRLQPF